MDKSPLRKRLDEYYDNRLEDTAVPSQIETRMLNLIYMTDDEMRRLRQDLNELRQHIIAGATTTAPIQDSLSGVGECNCGATIGRARELELFGHRADCPAVPTTLTTPPSSQSDTKTEDAGLAEQGSECAHEWEFKGYKNKGVLYQRPLETCLHCPAWRYDGKILVPVVGPDSSISARQDSSESVDPSAKAPAPFRLKWCPEMDMGIKHPEHDWCAKTDQGNYWYHCTGNLALDKPAQSVVE